MARRRSRVIVLVFYVTVITVSIGAPLLGRECVRWRESTNGTQVLRHRQAYPDVLLAALAKSYLPKQIASSVVIRSRQNSPVEIQMEVSGR
ncbi:hypothetical protein PSHT_05256 [Puccinia striiformis]|uniref:Uncharacterized protein n=1 Tax=Puccinia striiformis TaxID=27350 RepID=A0A2S4WB21_9BASI|nr:hypothetical protein PSHT_05256 [Puccinia striiformis]